MGTFVFALIVLLIVLAVVLAAKSNKKIEEPALNEYIGAPVDFNDLDDEDETTGCSGYPFTDEDDSDDVYNEDLSSVEEDEATLDEAVEEEDAAVAEQEDEIEEKADGLYTAEVDAGWTKDVLYNYASELGIPGRSKMNKAQLIEAINEAIGVEVV